MRNISDFLSKFKNLAHPDGKKELLVKFIFIETGLYLEKDKVDVRGRTLFIKADSYIKTEIFLKKEVLLKKIKENFNDLRIEDIK